jgi:hypothetical protein
VEVYTDSTRYITPARLQSDWLEHFFAEVRASRRNPTAAEVLETAGAINQSRSQTQPSRSEKSPSNPGGHVADAARRTALFNDEGHPLMYKPDGSSPVLVKVDGVASRTLPAPPATPQSASWQVEAASVGSAAGGAAGGAGHAIAGGPPGSSVSTASFISLGLRGLRATISQRAARRSGGSAAADDSAAEQLLELSTLWERGGGVLAEVVDGEGDAADGDDCDDAADIE